MNKRHLYAVLALCLGLLMVSGLLAACHRDEIQAVRERTCIYAKCDSWIVNGNDVLWYSDDRTTLTAGIYGDSGNVTAASATVGGGFGSTGCSISAAGVLQCDGATTLGSTLVVTGATTHVAAVDMSNAVISNIGNAGTDFDTAGGLTLAAPITATGAVLGGGYGSTGCSISNDGVLQCDGAGTFGGMTFAGALDMGNYVINNIGNAGTDFDANGGLTTASTVTVTAGGLLVTAGGVTITAGGLDMTNDPISNIGAAGTDFSATGGLTLADALTVSAGGVGVTGGLSSDYITSTGTSDLQGNVANSTGNLTLADNVDVTGGLDVQGGDITLQNDESISNSYNGVITFTATTAAFTGGLDVDAASDFAGNITMNGYNLIGPQLAMTFVGDGTRVLTNAESGSWWSDFGATTGITFTLPLSGEGAWYCIYNMTGITITIDPGQNASMIRRLTNCAGTRERIQSTTADDMICLFGANTDTQWFPWAVYGTWADIN